MNGGSSSIGGVGIVEACGISAAKITRPNMAMLKGDDLVEAILMRVIANQLISDGDSAA